VSQQLRVVASYTDGFGTVETIISAATTAVANVNDAPTGTLSITGTARQSQALTVSNNLSDADGLGAMTYQWQSSANGTLWSAIAAATGSSFVPTQAQVNQQLRVVASYTDGFGKVESITSAATTAVANVNDAPTGTLSVTGTARQSQALTVSNNLSDADGLGALSYQWQSSANGTLWSAIAAATGSSFVPTQAQVSQQLRVVASYTDGFGKVESITSAATTAVANVNDAPILASAIADANAVAGSVFVMSVPTNTFTDIDTGDVLTLSATLSNGAALPSWLSFNSATRSFSGTPPSAQSIDVRVSAKDAAGLSASDVFSLSVTWPSLILFGSSAAVDVITGGPGDDRLDGGTGVDVLLGRAGDDRIFGGTGNDLLLGGDGSDRLSGGEGQNVLMGEAGDDRLLGGAGNDLLIGGVGNDLLSPNSGADVIAFNRGDGQDTVLGSSTTDDTVSLGGGIKYADLRLARVGDNLELRTNVDGTDSLMFSSWYAGGRNVATLQVITEGTTDYVPGSSDTMRDQKVERFNFAGLVTQFDAARAANPGLTSWAISSALAGLNLGGSDTAAIGGDLAYGYARNTLSTIGNLGAGSVLAGAGFGATMQAFQSDLVKSSGTLRLG
jgi:Ca2+-binding RTX toxin-like protein